MAAQKSLRLFELDSDSKFHPETGCLLFGTGTAFRQADVIDLLQWYPAFLLVNPNIYFDGKNVSIMQDIFQ